MMLIGNLRDSLPGKVGKVLTCMDEIEKSWENQDLGQFPFNLLHGEIKALASLATSEYDDLDQEIDRRSGLLPVWWTPPYANSAFISNSMGLRYPSVECRRRGL